ncbi:BRO family protein [Paenibacillus sp. CAU 1782]
MNQLFKYGESEVRTVMIEGEPWFVAKDVADVLGFSETAAMTRYLDDDEVMSVKLAGMNMNSSTISESGLYSAILRSRKPEAKQFRKWITSEVLPTIRKTGGYVNNDDLFVNTYLPHADESTRLLFRTTLEVVRTQTQKIAILEPKAAKYDEFLDSDGLSTFTTVGKHFLGGISSQRVKAWLQSAGVLYKRKVDGCYPPTDKYTKYFRIVPYWRGGKIMRRTVKVTPEGIDFIVELWRESEVVAS